jgi:peptidoglycan/LPS O-acetylase OafA/YrhL
MRTLNGLSGLRGVAAYSVLLGHSLHLSFLYRGIDGKTLVSPLHALGEQFAFFGMSVFFVLSGFVIYYNYSNSFLTRPIGTALRSFLVARFARLYPLYALAILLAMVYLPPPVFEDNPYAALAYLTLTQSWFNMEHAVFAPAWSVSTEWFFYLVFVPLVFCAGLIRRPIFVTVGWLIVAPALLLFAAANQDQIFQWMVAGIWYHTPQISATPALWLWYYSPPVRLLESSRAYSLQPPSCASPNCSASGP